MKKSIYHSIAISALFSFCSCVGPEETIQSDSENADTTESVDPGMKDNSRNSLDWQGDYIGTLPCADCQGIQTQITLNTDKTYRIKATYLGKSDSTENSGVFTWNEQGNIVTLNDPNSGTPQFYLVGENTLTKLDMNGKKITGNLADSYVLSKTAFLLIGKYWKLTELNGRPVTFDSTAKNEPHIVFKMGNKLSGFGGCNNFSGSYILMGQNKVTISEAFAMTKMACPQIDIESEFISAIQSADSYSLIDEVLVLNKARTASLARFKTAFK